MHDKESGKLGWLPIIIFIAPTGFYLYEFFLRVAPSALFADLMADFHINATDLGLLSSAFFISYSLFQFPAGALLDRYGPRLLISLATLTCALGTYLFATTTNYHDVILARLLIGTASAFAFIGCMKIITIWFPPRLFPIFAGLTLTLGGLGAISGEAPISFALTFMNWRNLMLFVSGFGLFWAVYVFLVVRNTNPARPEASDHKADADAEGKSFLQLLWHVASRPQNWIIAIYGLLVTAPIDAFGGLWGVPYLVHAHGFSKVAAAGVVSMTFVGLATGSPFLGWLSNKLQSRKKAMFISSTVACLSLVVAIFAPNPSPKLLALAFFLFGAGGSFVLSFTVVSDINPPALVAAASGFINMFANLGSASLQPLIGKMLDVFWQGKVHDGVNIYTLSDYQHGLIILPLCYLLCLLLFIPLIKESYVKH